jgi:hypothetical protein
MEGMALRSQPETPSPHSTTGGGVWAFLVGERIETHVTDHAVRRVLKLLSRVLPIATLAIAAHAAPVAAQERLCDDSFEDCRTPIIQMIRAETVGIDVSYWFMDDTRYSTEIIKRWQAGVPVRIILDTRSDTNYPASKNVRQAFINAGIPIRNKTTNGINHWKMILYAGQQKMHFSAANFSNGSYSPVVPYTNYVDEAIYFTDDPALIHTFMTKYDSIWTDTTNYANLANVNGPLVRNYPTYTLSPDMNFPPDQDYQDRLIAQLKLETEQIDVVMFRITSGKVPDQLIARHAAGVPIRLITDQNQYRNPTYLWHSYNIDRMYMAGIPIKWKVNDSGQDVHQKSVVLYGRAMTVFGSSNWTASSSDIQREHNYFTTKGWFLDWFKEQFERKWNNMKAAVDGGGPISPPMYIDFEPEYPEPPVNSAPANQALGQATSVTLKWEGGYWAHKYDIYFGTSPTPPLIATDFMPGSATAGVVSTKESFVVSGLTAGTTYYWKIVGKTMANLGRSGPTWSFTTSGGVPPPPAPTNLQGSAVSSTQVNLTWTDVAGEEGYKVERKATTTTTWTQIAQVGADVASYTDANSGLNGGSSYNYRVRAFTSGGNSGYSNTLTVTMPAPTLSAGDVSLHAAEATTLVGSWSPVADSTAAGGSRLNNPNNGAATITTPQASPANYFEMSFIAQANTAYRLWIRGKGYNNSGYSDSVYAQFSNSVNSGGTPIYRIGTTSGVMVNLEDCSGCGINGWGWQDDGFGAGVLGPLVYFATSGVQTIRVQVREDGFSIDQIVLSPDTYLNSSPGALKLDTTILPEQNGAGGAPVNQNAARVIADAYVRGGSSAATKFGTVSELITKFSADATYLRESYIKLDISDVTAGETVKLRLFGKLSDTRAASVTTQVYSVADTSWTEAALTWNSKPAAGTSSLGSITVSGTTGQWYEVDLTSYAQSQRSAGKTQIAIALKCTVDTLPYITFGSRESGNKPELTVQ